MFKPIQLDNLRSYTGYPKCEDAYKWILEKLIDTTNDFLVKATDFNDRIKGNLGEFVAFHITRAEVEPSRGWYIFYSNADTPLSRISGPGLDICYLLLGNDSQGLDDRLLIQEIKTTGSATLAYAQALVADYEKLKSADTSANLQARVLALKARMRDMYGIADRGVLERVQMLAHPDPAKCSKVYLLPTLVHELEAATPGPTLADVREKIGKQGWKLELVHPINIGLTKLNEGFLHLAQKKAFVP